MTAPRAPLGSRSRRGSKGSQAEAEVVDTATSGAFAAPPTGACEERHPTSEALAEAAQGLRAAQTVTGQEGTGARGCEESIPS